MSIGPSRRAAGPAGTRLPRAVRALVPSALVALSTAGCATADEVRYGEVVALPTAYDASTYSVRQGLSVGEIVAALRSGRSSHDLAEEIAGRGLLAPATSADLDLLLQAGATEELIDAVREASVLTGRGTVLPSPPPVTAATSVIVTPPPLYPGYGWYPYAPYRFEFWYHDVPRFRGDRHRHHDFRRDGRDRGRPGIRRDGQSPRVSPGPGFAPDGGRFDRPGAPRVSPGASPRATPNAPGRGAVRDRRVID